MAERPRAIILLYVLMAIGALVFFCALFLDLFRNMRVWCQRSGDTLIARNATDAAIDDAICQLATSKSWTAGFQAQKLDSGATYSVSFDQTQSAIPASVNNASGASAVTDPEGRSIPAGVVHVIAIGSYQTVTRRKDLMLRLNGRAVTFVSAW